MHMLLTVQATKALSPYTVEITPSTPRRATARTDIHFDATRAEAARMR